MILQTEVDACVHQTLAEMTVKGAEIAVLLEQRAEIAEIISNIVRRDGRIFPTLPGVGFVRHTRTCAQTRIANFPDDRFVGGIVDQFHFGRVRLRLKFGHQFSGRRVRFFLRLSAKLDQQPAFAFRQYLQIARMNVFDLHRFNQDIVDSFQPDRFVFADLRDVIGGSAINSSVASKIKTQVLSEPTRARAT